MIVCPRCSKENQDHYKFCLGCGSELPRDAVQAPQEFSVQTPPSGIQAEGMPQEQSKADSDAMLDKTDPPPPEKQIELASTQVRADADEPIDLSQPEGSSASPTTNSCPHCGNPVPLDFKFCGTCGYNMSVKSESPDQDLNEISISEQKPLEASISRGEVQGRTEPAIQSSDVVRGELVLINPDGSEGSSFQLTSTSTSVGRDVGGPFAGDMYLSPVHASLTFKNDQLFIADQQSLNGVYIKIGRNSPIPISDGAIFRIGQEILRFEEISKGEEVDDVELMGSPNPGYIGRLCTLIGRNTIGEAFAIPFDGMHLGRERGDVTFPEDGYVSGLHCRIYKEGDNVRLLDVGSSNGTFLRISGEHPLRNGELVLMGQQLFSVRY